MSESKNKVELFLSSVEEDMVEELGKFFLEKFQKTKKLVVKEEVEGSLAKRVGVDGFNSCLYFRAFSPSLALKSSQLVVESKPEKTVNTEELPEGAFENVL